MFCIVLVSHIYIIICPLGSGNGIFQSTFSSTLTVLVGGSGHGGQRSEREGLLDISRVTMNFNVVRVNVFSFYL